MKACALRMLASPFRDIYCAPFFKGEPCGHRYSLDRDNDSLGQHCAEWQQLPFVALDTEFMRVDTFYPIAGLMQIGDGVRAYLIDP
jgi:hypothetical protein